MLEGVPESAYLETISQDISIHVELIIKRGPLLDIDDVPEELIRTAPTHVTQA